MANNKAGVLHTQGEWLIKRHPVMANKNIYAKKSNGKLTSICLIDGIESDDSGNKEELANAQLIAASPELLKALKTIKEKAVTLQTNLMTVEQRNELASIYLLAERVIKKAENIFNIL